jgi:hypothetical protein
MCVILCVNQHNSNDLITSIVSATTNGESMPAFKSSPATKGYGSGAKVRPERPAVSRCDEEETSRRLLAERDRFFLL